MQNTSFIYKLRRIVGYFILPKSYQMIIDLYEEAIYQDQQGHLELSNDKDEI